MLGLPIYKGRARINIIWVTILSVPCICQSQQYTDLSSMWFLFSQAYKEHLKTIASEDPNRLDMSILFYAIQVELWSCFQRNMSFITYATPIFKTLTIHYSSSLNGNSKRPQVNNLYLQNCGLTCSLWYSGSLPWWEKNYRDFLAH